MNHITSIPVGTSVERDALAPTTNLLFLNTDSRCFERYTGSVWVPARLLIWPPQNMRIATTTPVTVTSNDFIVGVKLAIPGASDVDLPPGEEGQLIDIKDALGDSDTHNCTINAFSGDTFEGGGSTLTLNFPFGSVMLLFHSGVWYPVGFT